MATSKGPPDLDIDDKSALSFIKWIRTLSEDDRVLRIFDRKSFFSVHGDDAAWIARTFYKSTGALKQIGSGATSLSSVAINRNLFEQVLRNVLVEQASRTVELYEGHGATWRIARHASPGNLAAFDDELFGAAGTGALDAPLALALTTALVEGGARAIGVAYVDAATRRIGAAQFEDDESLCALERVLVQLGAREVVVPQDTAASKAEGEKLGALLADTGALVTRRPRAEFAGKAVREAVAPLIGAAVVAQQEAVFERPLASSALAAVLSFTEICANPDNSGRFTLELYKPEQFMRLDIAAQRALHVFPVRAGERSGSGGAASAGASSTSIFGILNQARTAMGRRLVRSWLKQPLTEVDAIQARHTIVDAFVSDFELREAVRDAHLRGVPDVARLCRKLAARKITLQELCQLYMVSNQLPGLVDALKNYSGPAAALLAERFVGELEAARGDGALGKFEELLEAAIDLDAVPEEYLIDAGYDSSLKGIKDARDAANAAVANEAARAAHDLGLELDKSIKLEWFKSNNTSLRCMRITQKEEKSVRSKLQSAKYIVLETRKDGTKFTTKRMREAAEALNEQTRAYSAAQSDLVNSVREVAATYVAVWERVADTLAELDVLAGFAHAAASAPRPYVRPEVLSQGAGELTLLGCRHPCLELQDGVDAIANDCVMRQGESWFQLITGPNMGGKSTFIRQVGVAVLMAQVGSFVPADVARLAVRDAVFARVGAGDCQARGVSTFMAEMLETAAILKGATPGSLLIIDELGRGTSTYDGFGIAWALSEHIMQVIGAPTLFATHFHELTAITGPVGVANRHMTTSLDAASGRLTMLYRVSPGACDQSFGIHVAEFASFPPEVVARAKEKLAELEGANGARVREEEADEGGPLEVGQKRAREHDREGGNQGDRIDALAAMKRFLRDFAAIPVDDLGEEEVVRRVGGLKDALCAQAASNATLRAMLPAGAC